MRYLRKQDKCRLLSNVKTVFSGSDRVETYADTFSGSAEVSLDTSMAPKRSQNAKAQYSSGYDRAKAVKQSLRTSRFAVTPISGSPMVQILRFFQACYG